MEERKVVLILVDGMRGEAVPACGSAFAESMLKESTYTLKARTVMPSVTLPCHMSLFHSVDPERHGVLTNTYTPQVRPIDGLVEKLKQADKKCAFFYTWEQLRDLARPGNLSDARFVNLHNYTGADDVITDEACGYIPQEKPDLLFLYLGDTDECGHDKGWMSEEYLATVRNAWECIRRVCDSLPEEYDLIVIADHGGHARSHGTDMEEDMVIPVIMKGPSFEKGKELTEEVSILDIAPTIAKLLGAQRAREWEGRELV